MTKGAFAELAVRLYREDKFEYDRLMGSIACLINYGLLDEEWKGFIWGLRELLSLGALD